MNETELLKAFRNDRSEVAFAELVRRYADLVYSVAKRRVANATLAEDITQIVFIRFAKAPPKVQTHAELVAWLHRITINVAIDTWRSEIRRRKREQEAVLMEPTTNTFWEEISPKLDQALNQLSDEDREALLLRFFGRKTMRDVGAVFGVSEDAAKMRVSRAVDRLRRQLGPCGAACTAAVLATILAERSVEAAPTQLVSRLAAIRLPAAVGAAEIGGVLGVLLRMSWMHLAAGAAVLLLACVTAVHAFRAWSAPIPEVVSKAPGPAIATPVEKMTRERVDFPVLNTPAALPAKKVKILFHVVDAETGAGLPQTKIHFAFFGPGGAGEGHDILTDNNGDASIPEPDDPGKKGGPNVFVTAEGHVPKVVGFRNGPVPGDYTMRLEPAMTAGGLVVDEQGLPVAGVTILVQGPGNKPGQMENVDFQTCPVTNREDGSWSCSYIPKDCTEIWLILKKPGYAVTFPVVPVAEADLTNLVLVIDRGSIITGHVTDQQGQPVGNASVRVLNGVRSKRQSTRTDEAGNFMLSGISGEQLYQPPLETNSAGQVVIRGLGLPPTLHTAKSLRRNESPNDLARQKVLLERLKKLPKEEQAQAIVSGGVQDLFLPSLLEQLALHQRELKQLNEQFGPQHSAVQEVSTLLADLQQKVDARAQGVLSGLEAKLASLEEPRPPHVDLAVQAKGFAAQMAIVDLLSATNVINLSLAPGNIFRGRVVDEAGNPIPGAVIRTDFDFKNQIETRFEWTGHTDVNGRFEWDSAPAEDICYWFEAAGYEVLRGVPLLADSSDHEILLKSRVAK